MTSSMIFTDLPSGKPATLKSGTRIKNFNPNLNDVQDENGRSRSFALWPLWSPVRCEDFTNTGLYFTGTADIVKCIECSVEIRDWNSGQVPMEEHRERSPVCSFVTKSKSRRRRGKRGKKITPKDGDKKSPRDKNVVALTNVIKMLGYSDDVIERAIKKQDGCVLTIESTLNAIHQLEDEQTAKEISPKSTDETEAIRKENQALRLSNTCRMCLAADVQVVFQPCGHLIVCLGCLNKVTKCPKCRTTIVNAIRVYWS